VFEEVRDPGFAGRFVGGADPVPDHVHDDRRAVVLDDHDVHAVVELEVETFVSASAAFDEASMVEASIKTPKA
jgi:hypothetical protein